MRMRVLALAESPSHVCYRYRVTAYADALAKRDFTLETMALDRPWFARLAMLRKARAADVVLLQRKLLPVWQLALLRRAARRLVYDFDDAVLQRDSYSPKGPESTTRMARFWATVYAADTVVAGNRFLADKASQFAEPERVHVIPTCVTPELYDQASHRRIGSAVRLVWIGSSSTLPSLECARKQLTATAHRLPGLQLRLICDRFLDFEPLKIVARRWSEQTEADEIGRADIGISWLPDDAWSRGKCGLKVLQYMAAGLPVVANPVGMNRTMVVDGKTGFLASTPAEWAEAVARLAADPALRQRMGEAGRYLVETRYNAHRWGPALADLLEATAANRPTHVSGTLPERPLVLHDNRPHAAAG